MKKQFGKKMMTLLLMSAMAILTLCGTLVIHSDVKAATIPSGATKFKGHYYKVYYDNCTWSEAKAKCEEKGGYLVTITSAKEQAFIESINNECKWIGGYRDDYNNWYWVTGEKWSYTHWGEGEPNNSSEEVPNERYATVWPKEWNDLADSNVWQQYGYICEWGDVVEVQNETNTSLKRLKNNKKGKAQITWTKANAAGYELQMALNKKFSKGKKTKRTSGTTYTVTKLKKGKTYYVRVRAYNYSVNGNRIYGKWSAVKKIKIKR